MKALLQAPDLRKSAGPGLTWLENSAPFKMLNFVEGGHAVVYDVRQDGLHDMPGLKDGVLPGNVKLTSDKVIGQVESTPCNLDKAAHCGSHGNCQLHRNLPGFKNPGWCKCEAGYIGKFCQFEGKMSAPPSEVLLLKSPQEPSVPVSLGLQIQSFGGLHKDGDTFNINLRMEFSWRNDRFPWDAAKYDGSDAVGMLNQIWYPQVVMSGDVTTKNTDIVLEVTRDSAAEKKGTKNLEVQLKLKQVVKISHVFSPDFQTFPWDKHSLEVKLSPKDHDMTLTLQPGNELGSPDTAKWDNQWPLDADKPSGVVALGDGTTFKVQLAVVRAKAMIIYRLVIPMSVLVFMSWAGFFIAPGALMPRFASGFISFLALAGFKSYAIKMMPNEGAINGMSWVDVYVSISGFMMALAVAETVACQYINGNISRTVALKLDHWARRLFPLTFAIIMIVLSLPIDTQSQLILTHVLLAASVFFYCVFCWYEATYWPQLYIKEHVVHAGGAERHRDHTLTKRESQIVFEVLEKCEKHGESDKDDGFVHVETLAKWLIKNKPVLSSYPVEKLIRMVICVPDGGVGFGFPAFEKNFGRLIKELTLAIHEEPCEEPKEGKGKEGVKPMEYDEDGNIVEEEEKKGDKVEEGKKAGKVQTSPHKVVSPNEDGMTGA
jgi:hypothetical protein